MSLWRHRLHQDCTMSVPWCSEPQIRYRGRQSVTSSMTGSCLLLSLLLSTLHLSVSRPDQTVASEWEVCVLRLWPYYSHDSGWKMMEMASQGPSQVSLALWTKSLNKSTSLTNTSVSRWIYLSLSLFLLYLHTSQKIICEFMGTAGDSVVNTISNNFGSQTGQFTQQNLQQFGSNPTI